MKTIKFLFFLFCLLICNTLHSQVVTIQGPISGSGYVQTFRAQTSKTHPEYQYRWRVTNGSFVGSSVTRDVVVHWDEDKTWGSLYVWCFVQYTADYSCEATRGISYSPMSNYMENEASSWQDGDYLPSVVNVIHYDFSNQ